MQNYINTTKTNKKLKNKQQPTNRCFLQNSLRKQKLKHVPLDSFKVGCRVNNGMLSNFDLLFFLRHIVVSTSRVFFSLVKKRNIKKSAAENTSFTFRPSDIFFFCMEHTVLNDMEDITVLNIRHVIFLYNYTKDITTLFFLDTHFLFLFFKNPRDVLQRQRWKYTIIRIIK